MGVPSDAIVYYDLLWKEIQKRSVKGTNLQMKLIPSTLGKHAISQGSAAFFLARVVFVIWGTGAHSGGKRRA